MTKGENTRKMRKVKGILNFPIQRQKKSFRIDESLVFHLTHFSLILSFDTR